MKRRTYIRDKTPALLFECYNLHYKIYESKKTEELILTPAPLFILTNNYSLMNFLLVVSPFRVVMLRKYIPFGISEIDNDLSASFTETV